MIVVNTKENRDIKKVAASMAIENMFFDEEFIQKMIKVSKGEKSTADIIKEIIKEYGR